jgi:hypothetical protein
MVIIARKPTNTHCHVFNFIFFISLLQKAFGDQGALFEKTAPWTPAKTFD